MLRFASLVAGLTFGLLGAHTVQAAEVAVEQVVVYSEEGRFGGWPANHGIWHWDNEILVGYTRGYYRDRGPTRHHIDDEKPEEHWLARSRDGGRTWTHEHPAEQGMLIPRGAEALHGIEDPERPLPPYKELEAPIDFQAPGFAMTFRMSSTHAGLSRFEYTLDKGHHWVGPFALPDFGALGTAARTAYVVDGPRTLTAFITVAKENGRQGRSICIRTTDGGVAWEKVGNIGPEPKDFSIMPSAIRIDDDILLAAVRRREADRRWIGLWRSADNGVTWEALPDPVENLGVGNPPSLIQLADKRLALVYGVREAPFRIAAKISDDQGQSWFPEIVLRDDGQGRDIGYVQSVQRPDGKIVSVYYITTPEHGPERSIEASIWMPPTL